MKMDLCCILHILMMGLTISTTAVQPINSSDDIFKHIKLNNKNSPPQRKLIALFNRAANGYVRVRNKTVDARTTNIFDNDIILKVDMYGPTLLAIRSNRTGKYVCHDANGYVVVEDTRHDRCLYISDTRNAFHIYRSYVNKQWYLGFQGKGPRDKIGLPRHGGKTSTKSKQFMVSSLQSVRNRRKLLIKRKG